MRRREDEKGRGGERMKRRAERSLWKLISYLAIAISLRGMVGVEEEEERKEENEEEERGGDDEEGDRWRTGREGDGAGD